MGPDAAENAYEGAREYADSQGAKWKSMEEAMRRAHLKLDAPGQAKSSAIG